MSACIGAGIALHFERRSLTEPRAAGFLGLSNRVGVDKPAVRQRAARSQSPASNKEALLHAPETATLRFAYVQLPVGTAHRATRSGLLDLSANSEYVGPMQQAAATHAALENGTWRASEASCAEVCKTERRVCSGYAWRPTAAVESTECYLIWRRVARSMCESPSNGTALCRCDGLLSDDQSVCCQESCGRCGGSGCASLPGGRLGCCASRILSSSNCCSEGGGAPCVFSSAAADATAARELASARGDTRSLQRPPLSSCETLADSRRAAGSSGRAALVKEEAPSVDVARADAHAPPARFILVTASARVGSNWLRTMLSQHPDVLMEGELLSLTTYRQRGFVSLHVARRYTPLHAVTRRHASATPLLHPGSTRYSSSLFQFPRVSHSRAKAATLTSLLHALTRGHTRLHALTRPYTPLHALTRGYTPLHALTRVTRGYTRLHAEFPDSPNAALLEGVCEHERGRSGCRLRRCDSPGGATEQASLGI